MGMHEFFCSSPLTRRDRRCNRLMLGKNAR